MSEQEGPGQGAAAAQLQRTLENVSLRLNLRRGGFPYGRGYGSRLHELDRGGEHAAEQAAALANEALLDLEGVTVRSAELLEQGIKFIVYTPFGEGEAIYGEL